MKKRIWVITAVMVAALSFSACGKEETPQKPVEEVDFSNITEKVQEQTAQTIETELTTEVETVEDDENHEGMYRSELTNEWIDESLKNQRPIAVMVDNEKTALPHFGLTEADIVYELMNSTANGRITRLMPIVKDWAKITQFGSIRSARPTNIMLAAEWDAVLCHDGGPFYIDNYLANEYAAHFSGTFSRVKNGKPTEYTEYICTGDLERNFNNSKYGKEYTKFYTGPHYKFATKEIDFSDIAGAINATEINLPFQHNGSTLKYNNETKTYDYYVYGQKHIDLAHDNAVLTFKNVLIQEADFHQYDENGYMVYKCNDGGRDGYYITNGKAIPIMWIKSNDTSHTIYYNKITGEEIEINTGKVYITLVPSDTWDKLVIK